MTFLRRALAVLLLVVLPGLSGLAAQTDPPDFERWGRVSARAAEAIDAGRASQVAMETLRGQLVDWRSTFANAQSAYSVSIQTVKAQLDRLGPVPEGGDTEAVAAERARLEAALAQAREPILQAELAETEADELIAGVDKVLQERRTAELLQRGPTPLNPANWASGWDAITQSMVHVIGEVRTAWAYEWTNKEFQRNLPRILFLFLLGGLLVVRGRNWTDRAQTSLYQEDMSSGRWLAVFLISMGHVILPLVGVFLVTEAIYVTDLAGIRGGILLQALPLAAFVSLTPVWIGRRLFPIREGEQGVLFLSEQHRREGRYDCLLIGVVLGVETMIRDVSRYDNWSETASAVVYFPLILVSGLLILRFARILRAHVDTVRADAKAEGAISAQVVSLLAKALRVVAIVGMVLVAVGYARGAAALVFPAIYTVFLGGLIGILHRGLIRFLSLLSGDQESVESSLWSVLLAFLLLIAAVPLVLLFWGAGPQYISELIQKIGAGLRVGDVTISPREVLIFIAVFGVGYGLTRLLQSTLRNSVLPRTKLDAGGQNAVVAGVGYVGLTVAAIIAIQNTGIDLGSIALVASALSVGIGFGLQTVVSNFVSGIILLIERPIAEGDWIEVNGQMGYVRDISVRSTRIETFDRTDVIIPNSDLVAGTVTNYTRGNTVGRVIVPVGVAYGTDPRMVEKILLDVANAHPMVLASPAPYVVFQGFGASSLDFEIRAILRDVNWVLSVRSDMNYDIAQRFMEAGIEIPFPQQDIWLRNPEKLNTSHPVQVEPVSVPQKAAMPPDLSDVDAPDGDGGDR